MIALRVSIAACLVIACGGKREDRSEPQAGSSANVSALNIPQVGGSAKTLTPLDAPAPGAIVFVDDAGGVALAKLGAKWTGDVPIARVPVADSGALRRTILEAVAAGSEPEATEAKLMLAEGDDPTGEDESGGQGTALALEEGMRAEGQYKMKKHQTDDQLARQQAIEQARAAGVLGSIRATADDAPIGVGRAAVAAPVPLRSTPSFAPLILASPRSPATAIVKILTGVGGALGVSKADKLEVLHIGYERSAGVFLGADESHWVELHPEDDGLHVLALPTGDDQVVAWKVGSVDREGLRRAYDRIRELDGYKIRKLDIDILVRGATTAERLVDVIVAVDELDLPVASIGESPGAPKDRADQIKKLRTVEDDRPVVSIGAPNAQGELDKAIIRRYIKRNIAKIQYCYEKALLADARLAGKVTAHFTIAPNGVVTRSEADGVDPEVARCVAGVIKAIEFPKPKGGGSVQVNYPFMFHAAS